MIGYRPYMGKSVPNTVPKSDDVKLGAVAVTYSVVSKLLGRPVFWCNNCSSAILHNQHVCSDCGEEFDWDPIDKEKIKVCSKCKKEYGLDTKFCKDCTPPVKLEIGYR